jgi:hypothetical protein
MAGRRIRIDLRRSLAPAARWGLALAIVAAVVLLAWHVGRDRPVPAWISDRLVPALGWIYLALVAVALVHLIRKRLARRRERAQEKPR